MLHTAVNHDNVWRIRWAKGRTLSSDGRHDIFHVRCPGTTRHLAKLFVREAGAVAHQYGPHCPVQAEMPSERPSIDPGESRIPQRSRYSPSVPCARQ